MQNLHLKLTSKYPQYHNWHQTKHHNKIHWGVLAVFTLLVFGTILRWTPISFAADIAAPTTPTNLTATTISSSQINLSWNASTDNVGVTGYKIYRCSGSACAPTVQIATSAINSYSNTVLTASTAYIYAVSAYDGAGNTSAQSASASATTPAPSSNPIDNLQPGHWYEVPNSKLQSVLPNPIPSGGNTGPTSIINAWNGGAYDTKRDRLIIWGGGHADYPGNEIYVFDVNTLTWTRVINPSLTYSMTNSPSVLPDGTPPSVHTYGGLTYLSNIDRFWSWGGSRWVDGNNSGRVWKFDFNTLTWKQGAENWTDHFLGHIADYDAVTGKVFVHGYTSLWIYDPVANTWQRFSGPGGGIPDGYMGVIDPKRRRFYVLGANDRGAPASFYYDLNDTLGSAVGHTITTTGATEILNKYAPGLSFDPILDKIVAWSGGADVYTLDPDTNVWTKYTTTGSVIPTAAPIQGTWGRFRYVPSKNLFIAVNSINENIYFYKLSDTIPLSDFTLPSIPANLQATATSSSTVNLSWAASTDNVGVIGYRIYRNSIQIATVANLSYEDTGLSPSITYSYTVSAYDAAGNVSPQSISVSVKTRPIGQIDVSLKTWVARTLPTCGTGPVSCGGGAKHSHMAYNSLNGRLYYIGGDYVTPENGDPNGNNILWSYSIYDNNWIKEYPYCGPAGDITPARPDEVGWAYDSKRNLFYAQPGYYFGKDQYWAICGTTGATPRHWFVTFDPNTKKWTARDEAGAWPPNQTDGYPSEDTKHAVYDPVTDAVYRFRFTGGWGLKVIIFHPNTITWEEVLLDRATSAGNEWIRNYYIEMEYMAIDVVGRYIYAIEPFQKKLFRYNIDTKTGTVVANMPSDYLFDDPQRTGNLDTTPADRALLVWDSVNAVLLSPNIADYGGKVMNMYIFHPNTATWEKETVTQPASGGPVQGNIAAFDPAQNVMMLIGGHANSNLPADQLVGEPTNFFLYRYGNGSNGPISDNTLPSIPANFTATPLSSSQINLFWNASTDNVGVTGYKIYRCQGAGCTPTQLVNSQSVNSLIYNDTGLTASTAYTYAVSAYDAAGNESAKSSSVSATTLAQFKQADFNKDGIVNQLDFDILKQDWNRTDKPVSDLNQDGVVDSRDLGIMMSEWTK